MSDWKTSDKVVKKSIALHPIMDHYIRKTWAILIDSGKNASYSTALNYMLLNSIFLTIHQGIDENTRNILAGFLEDQNTITKINFEDLLINYREALKKQMFST